MLNEIDKKIIEFEVVSADEWIGDNSEEICLSKVRKVFGRLTSAWLPILTSRNLPLPENEYELAELIFSQPDYQSRAQREAKTPEQLLEEARDIKINQIDLYKKTKFAEVLLVRASNGSGNPDYYLKPAPEQNIFLAGHSMLEGQTKKWRAFNKTGNKISKENGDPLFLELTKSELISVSDHYEDRKTLEFNQTDLKIAAIKKLNTIQEIEAFDANEIISE